MAKEDAAEQVKEVLRQLIKHRFWIAVGFAALFAVIAYFMGAGPVQAKATAEKTKIINAEKDVRGLLGQEQAHAPLRARSSRRRPTSSARTSTRPGRSCTTARPRC